MEADHKHTNGSANGKVQNGFSNGNGHLKSSYATGEYSKIVQEGYSNGINSGYVSQTQQNGTIKKDQ